METYKESAPPESIEQVKGRLVELVETLKSGDSSAYTEIDEILKEYGPELCEVSHLYSEYTSENIAFIELTDNLFLEVSITGSFGVSLSQVLDKAGVDQRIKKIEEVTGE